MTVKAHIYSEEGSLLGYIAYTEEPPKVLELNGRFFQHHGVSQENQDDDDCGVIGYDYWEIRVEEELDVIHICVFCGRNASLVWWKCCPDHMTLDGQEVACQACVEKLHPGDPEYARQ